VSELDKVRMGTGQLGRVIVLRLAPGNDILKTIKEVAEKENIKAGIVLSGAASLTQATLRNVRMFPNKFPITDRERIYIEKEEPLEMLNLSGNISSNKGEVHVHCHLTISSGLDDGIAYGGHLVDGCIVFSTGEIAIAEVSGVAIERQVDPETKALELYFKP
jgi:predicted DNA-binding protein with PD1-like motif